MKKLLYVLLTVVIFLPLYVYSQSNTYCDGNWTEQTSTYNCSSFNDQVSCENIESCSWEYSWGGWVSGGSNDCLGGQVTTTDIYCDGELLVLGCTDETATNYLNYAIEDDGSCIWLDCEGELSNTSLSILVEDSVCHNNLYCEYYNWDGGDCVQDCNNDLMTIWDIDTYFYNGQCDQILDCMFYNFDNESCIQNTNSDCGGISITLANGWSMMGFSCSENTDAIEAFSSIQDKIVIAKDASGNAFLPSFNFNGIGDLERGYGYLIKVTEEISNYNICD